MPPILKFLNKYNLFPLLKSCLVARAVSNYNKKVFHSLGSSKLTNSSGQAYSEYNTQGLLWSLRAFFSLKRQPAWWLGKSTEGCQTCGKVVSPGRSKCLWQAANGGEKSLWQGTHPPYCRLVHTYSASREWHEPPAFQGLFQYIGSNEDARHSSTNSRELYIPFGLCHQNSK